MAFKHGDLFWTELITDDPVAACDWYRDTLGWTFERTPMDDGTAYNIALLDGVPVAGIMSRTPEMAQDRAPHWLTFFSVNDVDAVAQAAQNVYRGPFDIEGVGRVAILRDGGGAVIGVMTPT